VWALVEDRKRREADDHRYIPFKANLVPRHVGDRNLYNDLIEQNERRR
jgi:hypothetical protein